MKKDEIINRLHDLNLKLERLKDKISSEDNTKKCELTIFLYSYTVNERKALLDLIDEFDDRIQKLNDSCYRKEKSLLEKKLKAML